MKKYVLTIAVLLFVLMSGSLYSLSNFNYTGIAFNGTGEILPSQSVNVNIKIIVSGTVSYEENHTGVTTDQFGAYTVEVGSGTLVSGVLSSITATKELRIQATISGGGTWVEKTLKPNVAVTGANTSPTSWELTGNAGTTAGTDFVGTTDNIRLDLRANNTIAETILPNGNVGIGTTTPNNTIQVAGLINFPNSDYSTFIGYSSGNSNTGDYNTAVGYNSLYSNTTGYENTVSGYQSLYSNTTGFRNTASGYQSLYFNTTGRRNTASGDQSLYSNTKGYANTAIGDGALYSNDTTTWNTAIGIEALYSNTGDFNTAIGAAALYSNTTGYDNTASGINSLYSNTTGIRNTASGVEALYSDSTGDYNTASGAAALHENTTGDNNTASGSFALYYNTTGNNNTASGYCALLNNTTGSNNVAIGRNAGRLLADGSSPNQSADSSIYIGYNTKASANDVTNEIVFGYNAIGIGSNTVVLGNNDIVTTALKGNVGIGTTTPSTLLDVNGNTTVTGDFRANGITVGGIQTVSDASNPASITETIIQITYGTTTTYTLPAGTAGQIVYVANTSAVAHTVGSTAIAVNTGCAFVYLGGNWIPMK